jgi:hypothetical protein
LNGFAALARGIAMPVKDRNRLSATFQQEARQLTPAMESIPIPAPTARRFAICPNTRPTLPGARASKSVIHLKVDGEYPDIHSRKP